MIAEFVRNHKTIILCALIQLAIIIIACIIYHAIGIKTMDGYTIHINNMSVSLHKDSNYQLLKMDDGSIYDFQLLSNGKAVLSAEAKTYSECNDIIEQCKNSNNKDNIDDFKLDNMECTIISQDASNVFNMVFVSDKSTGHGFVGYSPEDAETIKRVLRQITIF